MKNLTYQVLSDEYHNIFLSFEEIVNLVHSIVTAFADADIWNCIKIIDKISDKLESFKSSNET